MDKQGDNLLSEQDKKSVDSKADTKAEDQESKAGHRFLSKRNIIVLVLLVIAAMIAVFIFKSNIFSKFIQDMGKSQVRDWKYELSDLASEYREVAGLVAGTISKNASIVINLPDELGVEAAQASAKSKNPENSIARQQIH